MVSGYFDNVLNICNCFFGSLGEGLDYEATSHTITIPAGSDNGSLTCTDTIVFVLDDDIVEYPESFGIQLVSIDPLLYSGDPDNATVVIVDNDSASTTFELHVLILYLLMNCHPLSHYTGTSVHHE